jgi:hypothetical protein
MEEEEGDKAGHATDFASRFLETSLDDNDNNNDDEQQAILEIPTKSAAAKSAPKGDLLGFLLGIHGEQQNQEHDNMWDQHSQRGAAVDQSINLMDTTTTNYEQEENRGRRSPSSAKVSHLQALKQPFTFLLRPSSPLTDSSSATVVLGRESKPLVDIELNSRDDWQHTSVSSSSRKKTTSERFKMLTLLASLFLVMSTFMVLVAAPKHSQRLFDSNLLGNSTSLQKRGAGTEEDIVAIRDSSGIAADNATEAEGGADSASSKDGTDALHVHSDASNAEVAFGEMEIKSRGHDDPDMKVSDSKLEISGDVSIQSREKVQTDQVASNPKLTTSVAPSQAPSVSFLLDIIASVPQSGSRMDAALHYLEKLNVSDPGDLRNPMKAANMALHWISDEDSAQLLVPGYNTTRNIHDVELLKQLLQRYAMAVLFYEMHTDIDDDKEYDNRYEHATANERANRNSFDMSWRDQTRSTCEWYGVKCEEDQIVALNMTQCLLSGTLPLEIFGGVALPRLSSLDFSHNYIRGELPETLSLVRMEGNPLSELRLQHNHIRGRLDQLTSLKNLSRLPGRERVHLCIILSDALVPLYCCNSIFGREFQRVQWWSSIRYR